MAGDMSPFVMAGRRMAINLVVQGVVSFHMGRVSGLAVNSDSWWGFRGRGDHEYQGISGGFGLWQGSDLVFGPAWMNGSYVTKLRTVGSLTRETIRDRILGGGSEGLSEG